MTNIRILSPSLQKLAIEELNEDPERIQADIDTLRDWINKQPHLKARTSDQFLVAFLRGSKHSLERAKQKIDKYYSLRQRIPELYNNRNIDDPRIMEILKLGVALRLPLTDGEAGPRISIIRSGVYDPDKYTLQEIIKVGSLIADIQMLEDDNSIISGYVEILDLDNVKAGHLFQLDMNFFKKLSILSEEGMPIRQKGFHFINTPPTFEAIYNVFQTFMPAKSKKRLFVHGNDMESLYKVIPKKLLPAEYGGENSNIKDILDYWEKKFLEYRDYFLEEQNYGSDEKLRIGAPLDIDSVFGVDGSFRKLNVD